MCEMYNCRPPTFSVLASLPCFPVPHKAFHPCFVALSSCWLWIRGSGQILLLPGLDSPLASLCCCFTVEPCEVGSHVLWSSMEWSQGSLQLRSSSSHRHYLPRSSCPSFLKTLLTSGRMFSPSSADCYHYSFHWSLSRSSYGSTHLHPLLSYNVCLA